MPTDGRRSRIGRSLGLVEAGAKEGVDRPKLARELLLVDVEATTTRHVQGERFRYFVEPLLVLTTLDDDAFDLCGKLRRLVRAIDETLDGSGEIEGVATVHLGTITVTTCLPV